MALVVSGLRNKQVGGELGISEITVGEAKDEGQFSRRPGDYGRETPPRTRAEKLTLPTERSYVEPLARSAVQFLVVAI